MTPYQEKIYNNPFRILGVYANASIKDIKANEAKAKAFLNVGKDVTFPCDFNQIIPLLERTPEMMESANAQLTLPNEKIKYALFWFVKVTPLDEIAFNHLANGNFEHTLNIWRKKECFSSLLNISTLALIHGHYLLAVDSIIKMLESEKHKQDFISSVVDETFQISVEELVHSFLDVLIPDSIHPLLEASTRADTYKEYIKNKVIKPIIDEVETEITKAKSIKHENSSARYNAGVRLMNLAKSKLEELKKLLVGNDMRYQIIADKLGLEILQCGIDYYNNSDDTDAAHKAMKIQSYAQSVVVGQMAKDRCKQNTDILKKIITELPPIEVREETKKIKEQLDIFSFPPYSIGGANELMKSCVPYIVRIKEQLGADHKYYLTISSRIVECALQNIIDNVNRIVDNINKGKSHIEAAKNSLLKAWQSMLDMEMFDMESSFAQNRFLPQKKALKDLMYSIGLSTLSIMLVGSTLDLRTDEEIFNTCNNIDDYRNFIDKYPQNKFVDKAKGIIETDAFNRCEFKIDYLDFIDLYPNSKFVKQAKEKIANFERIEELNRKHEIESLNSCHSIKDYEQHLIKYSSGYYWKDAREKLERLKNKRNRILTLIVIVIVFVLIALIWGTQGFIYFFGTLLIIGLAAGRAGEDAGCLLFIIGLLGCFITFLIEQHLM